ncbi:MAG: hypothetical protein JWO38_6207 [Gemmataceae bacterium]|nr:hypothetical protein [Gemmataceae bacterium]
MTLEKVRGALGSSDPAADLDRLVRDELATGRTTAEIYSALLPIVRTIRKTSKLSEDVDEILLGTLDALIGNCNPDECYQDPPKPPTLPNQGHPVPEGSDNRADRPGYRSDVRGSRPVGDTCDHP